MYNIFTKNTYRTMNFDRLFEIKSNTLKVKSGEILISEPFLSDFYFTRSVIFLVDHDEDTGSLGVIINKRLSLKINDIIDDFPKFDGDVYLGGPVATDSIFFIHTLGVMIPDSIEIHDGIFWSGNINAVKALIREGFVTKHDIRFYVGYAGWDAGQLVSELKRNSWLVGQISSKLILTTNPSKMWSEFVNVMGEKYKFWNKFPINPNDN